MSIEKHAVESAAGALGSAAVRAVAERGIQELASRFGGIDRAIDESFKVEGRQVTILCASERQRYFLALTPKQNHLLPHRVKFGGGAPSEVSLTQFRGLGQPKGALELTEDGFTLDLKELRAGEQYLLSIDYDIPDMRFLDSLVDRVLPKDVPHRSGDTTREYDFSAQLRFPQLLKSPSSLLSIKDIPLTVSVAVHQDVSTAVPYALVEQLENLLNLSTPHGRSEMFQLAMKQYQLQQHKGGSQGLELLKSIREVFLPSEFQTFIDVLQDFEFDRCYRGKEYYDILPFSSWPRDMKVISVANIDYDHPLAEGRLIYRHSDFIARIQSAIAARPPPGKSKTAR